MTTFSYDGTIPNPNDPPNGDVDQMQTNSASISGIIAVDHVGFNLPSGGEHNQISFAANNVPSFPTGIVSGNYLGVAFTNNQDGNGTTLPGNINQLFYFGGASSTGTKNQYVAAGNGSVLTLGGIIIKWGSGFSGAATISFTTPFPNNCFVVLAMSADTGTAGTANTYVYARNWNVTGFSLLPVLRTSLSAASSNYAYIAIGN